MKKTLYNYRIIAQKLAMLRLGVRTINAEFIQTHALSQLSFVQFRPYATLFLRFLLFLTLFSKSKKTLETSSDLTPSFTTSVDARVDVLVSNMVYLENRHRNFIQIKYDRKTRLPHTHHFVIWTVVFLSFQSGLFTPLMTPTFR